MTPEQVLQAATERGIRFDVDAEGRLIARPSTAIDDTLRAEIRQHKPELVKLVSTRATGMPKGWEHWPLASFAEGDHVLKLYSKALGAEVVIAGELGVIPKRWTGLPAYQGSELLLLAQVAPSPAELRKLHAAREIFDTTLAEVVSRDPEEVIG